MILYVWSIWLRIWWLWLSDQCFQFFFLNFSQIISNIGSQTKKRIVNSSRISLKQEIWSKYLKEQWRNRFNNEKFQFRISLVEVWFIFNGSEGMKSTNDRIVSCSIVCLSEISISSLIMWASLGLLSMYFISMCIESREFKDERI